MTIKRFSTVAMATLLLGASLVWQAGAMAESVKLDNAGCLSCHDGKKEKIEVPTPGDETRTLEPVVIDKMQKSLHSKMQCVDCHKEIIDSQAKHQKAKDVKPASCPGCHEKLWESAQNEAPSAKKDRLQLVVNNAEHYKNSFHARPDTDNPWRPKATCSDCHSSHYFHVPPKGTPQRDAWRKEVPNTCGEKCHEDQLESFVESVHGEEALEKDNAKSAVCTDCHSSHDILNTSSDNFKLTNVNACGTCHAEKLKSYADTYHGQVNRLGFAYTARCSDCHTGHSVLPADNKDSSIHPKNRLKTCQKCHSDKKPGMRTATAGFVSFAPHATTHDFKKYPEMYITSKFMVALLLVVFAYFWTHSLFWFYREWKDRQQGKTVPHIKTQGLAIDETKHFRRFHWGWRVAHLSLILAVMTLVLTGVTVLYAQSAWAPVVAKALGGPKVMALVHRIAAATFVGLFLGHLIYVLQKLLRDKTFRWFGPDSLVPNWKDLGDALDMFKWFFGKGDKPKFARFTYFEKFDYWAVFWGVNVIGWSGLMLAFPHVTAQYLPGWVFNVATLFHGEEAFLAAVFLFTVHFFNNHFRPDKLPQPDIVMFTGTQSLAEFRHEHPAQYQRLVESGELGKHLVDAPSTAMTVGSKLLGLVLLAIGLSLLALVSVGFFSHLGL